MLEMLEPDSILFLGDLFDGGREWATLGRKSESPENRYRVYGEGYWLREYRRFSRLFFQQWTDYVDSSSDASTSSSLFDSRTASNEDDDRRDGRDETLKMEGGRGRTEDGDSQNSQIGRRSNGIDGRKRMKRIIATLPGNHDLGLGSLIPLPVRDRFHAFFGEGNRVDVLGNHTFVGIDAVSLSAKSQFASSGQASPGELEAVWKPTLQFLDEVRNIKKRVVKRELEILNRGQGGKKWKRSVGELARTAMAFRSSFSSSHPVHSSSLLFPASFSSPLFPFDDDFDFDDVDDFDDEDEGHFSRKGPHFVPGTR